MNRRLLLSGVAMLLTGCGDDKPKKKFKIAGGGLVFNYRYSQANIVIVLQTTSELPEGSIFEAVFDKPGSSGPERVSSNKSALARPGEIATERATGETFAGKLTYKLESSPMLGIKKDEVFKVTVRLLDKAGLELEREDTQFKSDQDQSTLPSKPLVDPSKPNYVPQLENLK
jgi:hypothetical protein